MTKSILVPYDFTPAADRALESAITIAKMHEGSTVEVLNVVTKDSEKNTTIAKLKEVTDKHDFEIGHIVLTGKVLHVIPETLKEMNYDYACMGTHGVHGMQNIFGPDALKVITDSNIPFIITQDTKSIENLDTVVVPFSYSKESIQIGQFIVDLVDHANCHIKLVGYMDQDQWLKMDMITNKAVIAKLFKNNELDVEFVNMGKDGSYEDNLLKYAEEINADMIAAAHFSGSILSIRKNFVRDMINNKYGIPVLTVKTEANSNASFSAY
ncbi:MAG: universal stress protein [Crocinitomicaceae bacterium]|nr:universal stress protein [Crocinitomicaceae bacterium]